MRLFVHVQQSAPFLLEVEDDATIEQLNDLAVTCYLELYDHNPWVLKLNRVCRFKGGDVLLIYEKETVSAIADDAFDISAQERLAIYDEPAPTIKSPLYARKPADPTGIPVLKLATLNRVIIEMTAPDTDEYLADAFILGFRQFTTPEVLLQKLFERYDVPEPEGLGPVDRATFLMVERVPVQLNVCRVLTDYIRNFRSEVTPQLEDLLNDFIQRSVLRDHHHGAAAALREALLIDAKSLVYTTQGFSEGLALTEVTGKPFWEHEPEMIAEQLTLAVNRVYQQLRPLDFIGGKWMKKKHLVPALVEYIQMFERLSNFTSFSILRLSDVRSRKLVISKAIQVMGFLRNMNNFASLGAMVIGLNSPAVIRLTQTFSQVPSALTDELKQYSNLMKAGSNYKEYRMALDAVASTDHCIPLLSMMLRDLVFISDGNAKFVNGLTNIYRCLLQFGVVSSILRFQNPAAYGDITPRNDVMVEIDRHENLETSEQFDLSFRIQPRKKS